MAKKILRVEDLTKSELLKQSEQVWEESRKVFERYKNAKSGSSRSFQFYAEYMGLMDKYECLQKQALSIFDIK